MRKVHFLIAFVVVLLDRLSKFAVERNIPLHDGIQIIPKFFRLTHLENRGAAFGLFADSPSEWKVAILVLFSIIALLVVSSKQRTGSSSSRATSSYAGTTPCGARTVPSSTTWLRIVMP